jgi:hypothetical protein
MGLLDEAIREHLELKRRRGADPAEIAREEHVALDPVFPAEHAAQEAGQPEPDDVAGETQSADPAEDATPPEQALADEVQVAQAPDPLAQVGQETAELDMQAVLDADPELPEFPWAQPVAASRRRITAPREERYEEDRDEVGFEWEVPGTDERERVAEPGPGQERLSFE